MKAVVFDFNGTLYQRYPLSHRCLDKFLSPPRREMTEQEVRAKCIGLRQYRYLSCAHLAGSADGRNEAPV